MVTYFIDLVCIVIPRGFFKKKLLYCPTLSLSNVLKCLYYKCYEMTYLAFKKIEEK